MHQNPLTIFTLAEHIYREGATSAQVSQVYIHKYLKHFMNIIQIFSFCYISKLSHMISHDLTSYSLSLAYSGLEDQDSARCLLNFILKF